MSQWQWCNLWKKHCATVLTTLASRIADIVAAKINDRLSYLDKTLKQKEQRTDHLELTMGSRIDQLALDNLELYIRRPSVRVSGINENTDGEQLDAIVTELFNDMDLPIPMSNVNRTHRIGPKTYVTNRNHSRQMNIQFKDYEPKAKYLKARKQLRVKQPNVFVSEDLTQKRATQCCHLTEHR